MKRLSLFLYNLLFVPLLLLLLPGYLHRHGQDLDPCRQCR